MSQRRRWCGAFGAAAVATALAGSAISGEDKSPAAPTFVLRGDVLRAGAPEKARVEVRRVATAESTRQDSDWYRRAATERALFATLADGAPVATVESGADGAFETPALPLGVYEVRAIAKDGASSCAAARAVTPGEPVRVTAELPGGRLTIAGRAVHRDGKPFRGLVALDARDFSRSQYGDSDPAAWPGAAPTGDDGRFVLKGVAAGLHRLVAVKPGAFVARSARFLDAEAPVFVVDEGTREIAGRVFDGASDAVVAGAIVGCPAMDDPRIAVATDADGAFRLALPDGVRELAVRAPGFLTETVTLRDTSHFDVHLVRGATVIGHVTAAADGLPVAGARVLAVSTVSGHRDEERVARTGADGRYEIAVVAPGSWAVFVLDEEHVSPEAIHQDPYADWNPLAVVLAGGELRKVDLTVVPCARIRGSVKDGAGHPVPDADVEAWPREGDLWSGVSDRLPRGTSRADGSFDFGWLPDRDATAYAHLGKLMAPTANLAPIASGGTGAVQLAMREMGFADVAVRSADGSPVAGAELYFFSAGGCLHFDYGTFFTRADGRVHAGPFEAGGEPTVGAEAEGFVRGEAKAKVGSREPLEIVLAPGRRIEGRVELPESAPRGDLWIDLTRVPAEGAGGDESSVEKIRAADDGRFRTRAVVRGRYRVGATFTLADGRSWIGSSVTTTEDQPAVVTLAPAARASQPWTLHVVDPDGYFVERGQVWARWKDPAGWNGRAGRIESGVATLELPVRDAPLWLVAFDVCGANGAPRALASNVTGPISRADGEATLHLVAASSVSGVARRADGSPVPGMTVTAVRAADPSQGGFGPPHPSTRTRRDGTFEIEGLAPGAYRIASDPPGGAVVEQPVVDAGTRGVELVIGRGVPATIRVLDWNGEPVREATVVVRTSTEDGVDPVAADATNANGELILRRVASRTPYLVHVQPPRQRGDLSPFDDPAWFAKDTEIRLVREFVVAGRVADSGGRGVGGVQVWARSPGGSWKCSATAAGGAFSIPHLPAAQVEVVVVRAGEPGPRKAEIVRITDAPLELRYEPGPSIEIHVERTRELNYMTAGMEVPYRATLVRGGPDGQLVETRIVREDEDVVFDHLALGASYSVWLAADPDVRTWELDGKCVFRTGLVPGDSTVRLTPSPGRSVEGRLSSPGRALPQKVRVTAVSGAFSCTAEVQGDRYTVRGLFPGLWTIEAVATSDGRALRASASVEAGESADLELMVR